MAKQTFTTGQVLTAAQMTSLQQTAMGGGSTTAKVASYVLVAADAGTVVQMNAAGATTITVNTALFAAGDTVEIQNVGAGVCTVTAGTATVNTSSTLALKQYDAGSLYFNTTSAAIFFATDAADSTSPLTTKGDLYTFSTLDARLPVGSNNQTLVADSAEATGLKWAANSQGMTLLSTTSLTGATTTISSIDQTYTNLYMLISGVTNATANGDFRIAPNTTTNASSGQVNDGGQNTFTLKVADYMFITFGTSANNKITFNNANNGFAVTINNYASATTFKPYSVSGGFHATNAGGVGSALVGGSFNSNTAITSLVFSNSGGNLSTGTVLLYGVK